MSKPTKSDRGFNRWPGIVSCHQIPTTIRIYESSAAFEGAHLWIAIDGECTDHLGQHSQPHAHLSVQSVKNLIKQLQQFVKLAESSKLIEPAKHKTR